MGDLMFKHVQGVPTEFWVMVIMDMCATALQKVPLCAVAQSHSHLLKAVKCNTLPVHQMPSYIYTRLSQLPAHLFSFTPSVTHYKHLKVSQFILVSCFVLLFQCYLELYLPACPTTPS